MKYVLAIILLCAIVVVYISNKRLKDKVEPLNEITCPDFVSEFTDKENVEDVEGVDLGQSISLGSYGKGVLYAQKRLNSQYGGAVAEDGKFGCETFFAVLNLTGYDAVEGFELNDLK